MIFFESYKDFGGAQRILLDLYKFRSNKGGKSSYLLAADGGEVEDKLKANEISYDIISSSFFNRYGNANRWLNPKFLLATIVNYLKYTKKLSSYLSASNSKVILCLDVRSFVLILVAAKISRKEIWWYVVGGLGPLKFVGRLLASLADRVFIISEELRISQGDKILPNSFDTTSFGFENLANKTGKYLYVGSITPAKGLHKIIVDFGRSNEQVEIDVLGEVVNESEQWYFDYLHSLLQEYSNVRVNFVGFVNNVHQYYSQSRALLFSSLNYYSINFQGNTYEGKQTEGSPSVIIEAILSGTYVISTNVTGVLELKAKLNNIYILGANEGFDVANKLDLNFVRLSSSQISYFERERNFRIII